MHLCRPAEYSCQHFALNRDGNSPVTLSTTWRSDDIGNFCFRNGSVAGLHEQRLIGYAVHATGLPETGYSPPAPFAAMPPVKRRKRTAARGRGRIYVNPVSVPQTCRSKLACQIAAIRVDLVPATSRRPRPAATWRVSNIGDIRGSRAAGVRARSTTGDGRVR